jgi:hypothetical protein
LPWGESNRGRPPVYNQIKLIAAILVKGMRAFASLATDLRATDYAEEFSKFEANLETFAVDGSALSGETLIEHEVSKSF